MIAAGLGILVCPPPGDQFPTRRRGDLPPRRVDTGAAHLYRPILSSPITVAHRRFQRVLTEVVGHYSDAIG